MKFVYSTLSVLVLGLVVSGQGWGPVQASAPHVPTQAEMKAHPDPMMDPTEEKALSDVQNPDDAMPAEDTGDAGKADMEPEALEGD